MALAAAAAMAGRPGPAGADRDKDHGKDRDRDRRASFGEYVKAARAVQEWRLAEARTLTAELGRTAPDEPETRYLQAQLAFLDGDYAAARAILDKLDDPRVRDVVRDLAPLVAATEATTRDFDEKAFAHFVIRYPPGKDEVLVDLAGEALEAAWAAVGDDLGWRPATRVRVEILPEITDLARVSTLTEREIETSGTIALCKYNKLMIVSPRATVFGYPWLDTLAHEYTHYVVSAASEDRVPIWLHEGLAKFEESRWRAAPGAAGLGRPAEQLLAGALKKGRLITFEEMHPSMAKLPSQQAAATAFAEVYTIVAWMQGKIGYQGIRGVLARIKDGRSERRAIAEVVGEPWPKVEDAWKRYLRGLKLEAAPAGKGAARKLVLKKGRKGDEAADENAGLDQVGEERARKLARLGGMLRARGRLAPAAVEYEKALAITGPADPFVAGKLAGTYLELGAPAKAVATATPLVAGNVDDAYPEATLGVAYLQLGDAAKAEQHLSVAVRISPFDPEVRCGLSQAYTQLGQAAPAERETAACERLGHPQPPRGAK